MRHPLYVLYFDDVYFRPFKGEPMVSVHGDLQDAEEMLRAYAAEMFPGVQMADSEIVKKLAEDGQHARIFACSRLGDPSDSCELEPFTGGRRSDPLQVVHQLRPGWREACAASFDDAR